MTFFTDPTPFTHHGSFYGFPAYFAFDQGEDGMTVAGTNAVSDWCVLHLVPWLQSCVEGIRYLAMGADYEPGGFQACVKGRLSK